MYCLIVDNQGIQIINKVRLSNLSTTKLMYDMNIQLTCSGCFLGYSYWDLFPIEDTNLKRSCAKGTYVGENSTRVICIGDAVAVVTYAGSTLIRNRYTRSLFAKKSYAENSSFAIIA